MKSLIFGTILILAGCLAAAAQTSNCPEIAVTGPGGVTAPGDVMTFTAGVNNYSGTDEIKYEWTLSVGIIEKGQGASSIEVRTTKEMANSSVTATVKISGTPDGCSQTAWETGAVAPRPVCECSDEFGRLSRDDLKARIDNFYIRLINDPGAEGLIYVRFDAGDTRTAKMSYLNDLYRAITFRKYDPARVTFIFPGENDGLGTRAVIYMVPAGGDFPETVGNSILIKGEDLKTKIKTLFITK